MPGPQGADSPPSLLCAAINKKKTKAKTKSKTGLQSNQEKLLIKASKKNCDRSLKHKRKIVQENDNLSQRKIADKSNNFRKRKFVHEFVILSLKKFKFMLCPYWPPPTGPSAAPWEITNFHSETPHYHTQAVPTDLLVNLLDLMMRHNIFEFNGELYRQLSGVDMGTRSAPSLANIFCAEIDKEIVKLAETYYKTRQWTPSTCQFLNQTRVYRKRGRPYLRWDDLLK